MLIEVGIEEAFRAFCDGKKGFALDPPSERVLTFEAVFSDVASYSYLVDYEENEPKTEESKPAEIKNTEDKQQREKRRSRKEVEQLVLKAWNGGEHTIKEIMDITGCTYSTVCRYIPRSVNG